MLTQPSTIEIRLGSDDFNVQFDTEICPSRCPVPYRTLPSPVHRKAHLALSFFIVTHSIIWLN